MKVRSDFVTNSSSSSTVAIRIVSDELARIIRDLLEWVRDAGEGSYILFDKCDVTGSTIVIEQWEESLLKPPSELGGIPAALEEDIRLSIEAQGLDVDEDGEPARIEALEELSRRAGEISSSISSVSWRFDRTVRGEFGSEWRDFGDWQPGELGKAKVRAAKKLGIPASDVSGEVLSEWLWYEAPLYEAVLEVDRAAGTEEYRSGWRLWSLGG